MKIVVYQILFLLFCQSINGQIKINYGIKGGITTSLLQSYDYEPGDNTTQVHYRHLYLGPNLGFFLKLHNIFFTDISIVRKGVKNTGDALWEPSVFITSGFYFKTPAKTYLFGGIQIDHLLQSPAGDTGGKVRNRNWSYSVGFGRDDLNILNERLLIELKIDLPSRYPMYKNGAYWKTHLISGDIRLGMYFK